MTSNTRLSLDNFRGDWNTLADLIQRSWAENKESSLRYMPAFLQSCFEYPGTTAALAPTIYEDDQPVAFIAGLPRHFEWEGRNQKLLLSTLLTSAPEKKGKGYGAGLWTELAKRARAAGYDGLISLCVDGGAVNQIVEESSRRLRFPTGRIYSVSYKTQMLKPGTTALRDCTDADVDLFLELAQGAAKDSPFRRVWTRPEAEWQCRGRTGAVVVSSESAEGRGVITGYVIETLSATPMALLAIEDLFWDELQPAGRVQLLKDMLEQGAARGARIASVPVMGYTQLEPLKTLKFFPSSRRMNVYVTRWQEPAPEPVPSVYLDVL